MRMCHLVRGLYVWVPAGILSLGLTGCDSSPKWNPVSVGVTNPDVANPLYGVTLENEAQNLDRIKAGDGINVRKKR
ncbi:hypothetical protein V5E97_22060 [Singulisphaera sp. Ch08]|uniref:Lipoprotein n=1 Tax=Singulisphaera sp. Ch08 TaxID=3120278 RepID=A0AAU7C7U0_9BACT